MKLLLSPHNDDEVLFTAFTILRERPVVCIVLDSRVQPSRGAIGCDTDTRHAETWRAMQELVGTEHLRRLGFSDITTAQSEPAIERAFRDMGEFEMVYAPAVEVDGHPHHNLVGHLAGKVFQNVTYYLTYTRAGKSRGTEVQIEDGAWIGKKLKALACYESQHSLDPRLGCWPHFVNDLREYYA